MDDKDTRINLTLRSIGKKAFVQALYPELVRDIDVSVEEIGERHSFYKRYIATAQRNRLSSARTLFREGWIEKALEIIVCSGNVDSETRKLAQKYLLDLRKEK